MRHLRQSQVTNVLLHFSLVGAALSLLADGPVVALILGLVAFGAWFARYQPFYFITDERVIVVAYDPSAVGFRETFVDHQRITSVEKRDPFFGALLGTQRIDIFVAESDEPKLSLRWLHAATDVQPLIGRRR